MTQKLDTDVSETTQSRGRFGTKAKAILAGGLVLGVGAAITLAAWTDQEWVKASFGSSTFGIEGSLDGTNFAEHSTESGAAVLVFETTPLQMSPNAAVYEKFVVRSTTSTTVPGTVQLGGATLTGTLGTSLTYGVRTLALPDGACDSVAFAAATNVVVNSGTALTTGATGTQVVAASGASPVAYCFEVVMSPTATVADQGKLATATWAFTATSN